MEGNAENATMTAKSADKPNLKKVIKTVVF
jgi:hypothetical protein